MPRYIKQKLERPVLFPKRDELNEMFLSDYNLSLYAGRCEFACQYCDGIAFDDGFVESEVVVDTDIPRRLALELADIPSNEVLCLGRGEAYQPAEKKYRLTRQVLNVLRDHRSPVVIITKSPAVCEDIPVLTEINRSSFVIVAMTLVTLDPWLSKHLEGQTPSPQQRLDAIAALKKAGIACGVALIPIFPFLTDDDASLIQMFDGFKTVSPDFVLWEPLWIHEGRHQQRLQALLASMDENLMEDVVQLYNGNPQPPLWYRQQLNRTLLALCEEYHLPPRIPSHVYENTLSPEIVAELRRRNQQFVY